MSSTLVMLYTYTVMSRGLAELLTHLANWGLDGSSSSITSFRPVTSWRRSERGRKSSKGSTHSGELARSHRMHGAISVCVCRWMTDIVVQCVWHDECLDEQSDGEEQREGCAE